MSEIYEFLMKFENDFRKRVKQFTSDEVGRIYFDTASYGNMDKNDGELRMHLLIEPADDFLPTKDLVVAVCGKCDSTVLDVALFLDGVYYSDDPFESSWYVTSDAKAAGLSEMIIEHIKML